MRSQCLAQWADAKRFGVAETTMIQSFSRHIQRSLGRRGRWLPDFHMNDLAPLRFQTCRFGKNIHCDEGGNVTAARRLKKRLVHVS